MKSRLRSSRTKAAAPVVEEENDDSSIEEPVPDESFDPEPKPETPTEETVPIDTSPAPEGKGDEPPANRDEPDKPQSFTRAILSAVRFARFSDPIHSNTSKRHDQESSYDEIVDRFIEYDLGRLHGEKAKKARRDFQNLGEYAIPALVRGLNKSAAYHASCPVGVISHKLTQAVQRTSDPELARYAIRHVGDGVTKDMPHASTVARVRDRLRNAYSLSRDQIAKSMSDAGIPVSEQNIGRVSRILEVEDAVNSLRAVETEQDLKIVLLAIEAQQIRRSRRIGYELARIMNDTDESEVRAMAYQNMLQMSDGADFGTQPSAARAWMLFWRCNGESRSSGRYLISALESKDREIHEAGVRIWEHVCYQPSRREVHRFAMALIPDLSSADSELSTIAATKLREMSGGSDFGKDERLWRAYWQEYGANEYYEPAARARYNSGMTLLRRDNKDGARRYFEKVIAEFPQTSAAHDARQQLNQMDRTPSAQ